MADIDSFTTYVQGKLTDVLSAAAGAAGDLENIAEGFVDFFTFNPVPEYSDATQMVHYNPANVTLGAVTPYAKPTVPTLEFSELGNPGTLTAFVKPTITGFNPQSFDPSTVDGEIAALAAKILEFIDSGGPGISDAVQTALMNNMRARDLQTLDDVLLRVRQENSMSGWPRSNSLTESAEAEHRKKWQDTYDNRSSEILALMTERAHQTAMNGLNAGVQTTQIKSNLQADVWKLFYACQGLILDKFKTDVGGEVSRVETDLKKILGDYDLLKTRALTESGIKLDLFRVESQGEETRVRTDTMLETAKSEIGLKSNDHLLSAALGETKSQLEKWLGNVDHLTKRGVANIQQLVSENEVRFRSAASEAEFYKGIIISLTQMVNTIQTKKT
jgi:hypothetical protein